MVSCKHNKYLMVIQPYSGTFDTPAPSSLPVRQVQLNTEMEKKYKHCPVLIFSSPCPDSQWIFSGWLWCCQAHTAAEGCTCLFLLCESSTRRKDDFKCNTPITVFVFLTVVPCNNTHELNAFLKSVKPLCHVHCCLQEGETLCWAVGGSK